MAVFLERGGGDLLVGYGQRKPVVSCILSPPGVWDDEIRHLEDEGALVNFTAPEAAALALANLWRTKKINAGR